MKCLECRLPASQRSGRPTLANLFALAWASVSAAQARSLLSAASCLLLALAFSAGCASGNNRNGLFGSAHPLIEQAKSLKSAYPEPLPLPRELHKEAMPPYVVEPGDVLLVQPANLDSPVRLPGDQPVLPDGRIQLGIYGQLMVAGKTVEQIEADVNVVVRAKTKDAGPITVRLVTRESKVYYVFGEVNAPGSFQYRGRETVLDAIVAAGGLTSNGSRRNIILSRPTPPDSCRIVLPICYNEIVQLGDTSTNYQLLPGDRIYVPGKGFCESLCPKKQECLPCGRAQTACPPPAGDCHHPTHMIPQSGGSVPGHVPFPAPTQPAREGPGQLGTPRTSDPDRPSGRDAPKDRGSSSPRDPGTSSPRDPGPDGR